MAGKGGGSWKVAYADFVTAMMAFFLVMWIGAQDQKTRQSVANYFIDPMAVDKKPMKAGAVFDSNSPGHVPAEEKSNLSTGRNTHSQPGVRSASTKRVGDFLGADQKTLSQWRDKASKQREIAAKSREVIENTMTASEMAVEQLSKILRTEMSKDVTATSNPLYQDLLLDSFADVNWKQLAEDLLYE